jgi:16S rRNA (adenine1518-N6/adenine1519-N6)-dimethyltransferase
MVYQKTASTLRRQGLAPSKKLGQNFLVHSHTAQRIVDLAGIENDAVVIEVGVGLGALTGPLAAAARQVIGIEADSGIIRHHEEEGRLPQNVALRHEDILKTDLPALQREVGEPLVIVANLPYSISSPFLFRLIEHHQLVKKAVVMVQKEVALRLMAEPGTKEYGGPTVLLAACATVTPLLTVKPGEFFPKPKVDSMVIRIDFPSQMKKIAGLPEYDRDLFTRIVQAGFGNRRKTLTNNLLPLTRFTKKEELKDWLTGLGYSPTIRAETFDLESFVRLTNALTQHLKHTT